ncbi:BTAD domain-containing putative transcriptional regulator, partial [Agromyces seonyuensis]|nr:AAA family ATPase [Agromyces seonyuensis]
MSDAPAPPPRFRLLGPVVLDDAAGREVAPAGTLPRALVAVLALGPRHPGDVVGVDAIADELWGETGPANVRAALQSQVSRLRRLAGEDAIRLAPGGYRLGAHLHADGVAGALLTDLELAEARIAAAESEEVDDRSALAGLDAADALWRGEPGLDLGDAPVAETLRARAAAARRRLRAVRVRRLIALGEHTAAVDELDGVLAADPYDEAALGAKLDALAAAGRRTEAIAAFAEFRRRLGEDLGLDPSAPLVERHARLLREVDTAAEPATDSSAAASDRSPSALPAPAVGPRVRLGLRAEPNPLLGRDVDVEAVAALLDHGRCVTILGPGGLGKTRLAQAVAGASGAPGVVFAELASVRSADDLDLALAAALGLRETTKTARLAEFTQFVDVGLRVQAALSERPTLLVLDNCEQIVDAAAVRAAELLAAAPALTILATSRSPLAIGAEHVYPLEPLAAGDGTGPAARLFLERAEASRPGLALDPAAVVRLCERLDGLPLAIELAAARVRSLGVGEIESRLADRFRLLSTGDRAAPERHRTLEAVIGWSWDLLPPAERRALARLAWFPDGFALDAAEAVIGDPDAVDLLDGLIRQSLAAISEHPLTGEPRYRMLETVREFGQARSAELGDAEEVAVAIADWAVGFARRRMPMAPLQGDRDQVRMFRELDVELDTLVAVLRAALRRRDARTAAVLAALLFWLWTMRDAHSEVAAFVEPFTAALSGRSLADVPIDEGSAALLLAGVTGLASGIPAGTRALAQLRVLRRRAVPSVPWLRLVTELLSEATTFEDAAERLPELTGSDDPFTAMLGELMSASFAENSGDPDASRRSTLRAQELARRSGDVWALSMLESMLASLAVQDWEPEEAIRRAERARNALLSLGGTPDLQQLDWTIVCALVQAGRLDEARPRIDALLADDRIAGDGLSARQFGLLAAIEVARLDHRVADADLLAHEIIDSLRASRDPRAATWAAIAVSGVVAGAAQDGRLPAELGPWVDHARRRMLAAHRLRPGPVDLPVAGTVLVALGAVELRGGDPARAA